MKKDDDSKNNKKQKYSNPSKYGKLDSHVLFDIKKYLSKKYHIRSSNIKIEHIIEFTKTGPIWRERPSDIEISNLAKRHPIRIPDIIVLDKDKKIWFVIEQDGRFHESKKIIEKDRNRNKQYDKACIPLIILNTGELKLERKAWHVKLDEQMASLGIEK